MKPRKLSVKGIDESKHPWTFSDAGLIGFSPKSDFLYYLVNLTQSDLNVVFNYNIQEKKKDDKEYNYYNI